MGVHHHQTIEKEIKELKKLSRSLPVSYGKELIEGLLKIRNFSDALLEFVKGPNIKEVCS